ncbi:ATP-binding protein [Nocardia sp. NPDC057353]|uniref:ATP-binding protein n=1 Tax=Nocardia sp. NPDC057353 TaxID=3346104 RepID=UPI00363FAE1B
MTDPAAHVLRTAAGPGALAAIHAALEQVWAAHPVPEPVRLHLDLAAGEIGANIVEHGTAATLRLEISVRPDRVQLVFTDDGDAATGIDLDAAAMPDPMADRGRGLALARAVLDEFGYDRDGAHNRWTLTHLLS